jgi:hypothetical protein
MAHLRQATPPIERAVHRETWFPDPFPTSTHDENAFLNSVIELMSSLVRSFFQSDIRAVEATHDARRKAMVFKIDRYKRVLGAAAVALVTTTFALGVPPAYARVDVGIGLGAPYAVTAPPVVTPYGYAAPPYVAPYAYAAPPIVGMNLGFGFGPDRWHGGRGGYEHGHGRR